MRVGTLKNTLRNLLTWLIFRLDTTKYLIDKPRFDYQPLPWVDINTAEVRGSATVARWSAIEGSLPKYYATIKDIGCCVGFFCHKFAEKGGVIAIGIDSNYRFIRIAKYVQAKLVNQKFETFFELNLTPKNINVIPPTDITILLSVWHHWVFEFGLEFATSMLKQVWNSTASTLYFESGEEEIAEEFNVPFEGVASTWLKEYLLNNLSNVSLTELGRFESGKYDHYELNEVKRTLFKLEKLSI